MGSRSLSHQLSGGLFVSGRPEQPKEKSTPMSSTATPYTGGDIKKSGELGKMFDLHVEGSKSRKSGPLPNAPKRTGSFGGAGSYSGPLNTSGRPSYSSNHVSSTSGLVSGPALTGGGSTRQKSVSGPVNKHGNPIKRSDPQPVGATPITRQNSGPLPQPMLPATGLITSGPINSGPLNALGAPHKVSGPLGSTVGSAKLQGSNSFVHNHAITKLSEDEHSFGKSFPMQIFWPVVLLFLMGFIAGVFILVAVHNAILLIVVMVLFGTMAALFTWNAFSARRSVVKFVEDYPNVELRTAKNGQYVKISGIVTCGNVPLESSFQKVPRCVYTSTDLYEYRNWGSKGVHPTHRRFTWELRSLERHAVDFYISDFQSGLRALVKTGYGARVTPIVDVSVIVDANPDGVSTSPDFLRWLRARHISSGDRIMRLKEGYIKEGSTVSVMGVVQRNENVLMIIPPPEPLSTGCQWANCFLPTTLEGIVLRCEDISKIDVIPV